MGSVVTVMLAGVVDNVACETWSHVTVGTMLMFVMGAPVLAMLRLADADALTWAERLSGLGMTLKVCAATVPANVKSSTFSERRNRLRVKKNLR